MATTKKDSDANAEAGVGGPGEMPADTAPLRAAGTDDKANVKVTAAHHLSAQRLRDAGIGGDNPKDVKPGDTLTLTRDQASAVISQGYAAGVNPQDPAQVRDALGD